MRSAWAPGLEQTWRPFVHANCPHNEVASLLKRTMGPLPDAVFRPLGSDVSQSFRRLRRVARRLGVVKWDLLQTAMSYKGRLGRRYVEAERSLRVDGPIDKWDSYLRPFLKAEKFNAVEKFAKPRMIFPRSPRFNLSLASRLKPFEHCLWGRLTARMFSVPGGVGRIVAKGLNPRQRANLIVRKFRAQDDAVVFEVDGKGFEAHVGPHQLKEEHGVYRAAFPGDRGLAALLHAQLRLEGKLTCGAKFSREGGRASGDFNTGMGNSLIMLAVVDAVLRKYAPSYDMLVDGDNALVFLPRACVSRVLSVFASEVLQQSGHEVTLETPTSVIEGITFGQSHPVFLGGQLGWTMVRDPRKVLSNALASHRWLREPAFAREWIRGVASCELSLALGVPMLQSWALELQRYWGGPEGVRAFPHEDYFYMGGWFARACEAKPVSAESRLSFSRAFGLSPEAQVAFERDPCVPRDLGHFVRVEPLPAMDRMDLDPEFTERYLA